MSLALINILHSLLLHSRASLRSITPDTMAFALSSKTASAGSAQLAKARAAKPAVARAVVVRAQANNAEDLVRSVSSIIPIRDQQSV
jgi:hypothetical protein